MWIIEATGKREVTVYKVDRRKCPDMWWSNNIAHALQYQTEEAAILHCAKYHFGNPRVRELDETDKFAISINDLLQDFKSVKAYI